MHNTAIDQDLLARTGTAPIPPWYSIIGPPFFSLIEVGPAFLVGWFARQRGFLLGAMVGVFGYYFYAVLFSVHWLESLSLLSVVHVSGGLLPRLVAVSIVASVSGAAGQLLHGRAPNLSLNRTPRRRPWRAVRSAPVSFVR
jgi:hypothetical protein